MRDAPRTDHGPGTVVSRRRRILPLVCSGAFTLLGCGGGGDAPSSPAATVQSVTVTPGTQILSGIGTTGQFTAAVVRTDGPVASPAVTWVSQNPTIATVSGSGSSPVSEGSSLMREGWVMLSALATDLTSAEAEVTRYETLIAELDQRPATTTPAGNLRAGTDA